MQSSKRYTHSSKGKDQYLLPKDGKFTETMVFLHGLSDSASGPWLDFFLNHELNPIPLTTKIILLNAPSAPVTIRMNMKMPSWYDIKTFSSSPLNFEKTINVEELNRNAERIKAVLNEEIKALGGESKKVILAGFSQGCAMALHTGLEFDKPLGGIIGWSGYLLPITKINVANVNTPIFLANGLKDPTVPFMLADLSYKRLDAKKHQLVRMNEDGLGHIINENIGEGTSKFLKNIFGK